MADKIVKYHPKIAKWIASTEKRTSIQVSDVLVTPRFNIEYLNSGSTIVNLLIGGSRLPDGSFVCPGWARGTINEIYGRESSGKSTVAMTAMGLACANGGTGLYVDLECAVRDNYAAKLGCDFRSPDMGGTGAAIRIQPRNFEETEALVTNAALQGIDFIVIDSVAAFVSRREQRRDVSDEDQKLGVAEIPRLMAGWLPKLQNIISHTKTAVLFLNQTRDKIGAKGFTEEALKSTTGGNALKFYSAVRLLLRPRQITKAKRWNPVIKANEEVEIANDVEVKVIKNKLDATKGHSGLITLRYGVGIDELLTMMNVAEAYKIIKKSKNARKQDVFQFKSRDGHLVEAVGVEKFRLSLSQQTALLEDLFDQCRTQIVEGFRMMDDEQLAALAENSVSTITGDDDDDYDGGGPPDILEQTEPDADDGPGAVLTPEIDV